MHRSSYRYVGKEQTKDAAYRPVLDLSGEGSYFGYRKIYDLMRPEAHRISRERVRAIRRREGLQVVRKRHKRQVWGMTT